MNTTTRALAGLAAAAAVAVAGSSVAGSSVAGATKAGHAPVTMHFVSTEEPGNFALADLGPPSQPGEQDISDVIAFTNTLSSEGRSVRQIHLAGVGVDHQRKLSQATGTISLGDGSIEFAGIVPRTAHFDLAVTGGTGRYIGAEGTLGLDFTSNQPRLTLTLRPGR